jgi:hypothetical protein
MCRWQSGHECGTCMMLFRRILTALCDMVSIISVITNGQVENDPMHGPQSRKILTFWFLPVWTPKNPCVRSSCWQQRNTSPSHCERKTIWNYPGIFERMGRFMMRRTESHEDILATYCECTVSAATHKVNVFGRMLLWLFFYCFRI